MLSHLLLVSVFHVRFHLASRQYHGDPCAPQNISFSIRAFPPLSTITLPLFPTPLRILFFSSLCLFPPFRDPRLCHALYFFRARNHRERKTPFRSPKENHRSSPPCTSSPFSATLSVPRCTSFLHGLPGTAEPKPANPRMLTGTGACNARGCTLHARAHTRT